MVMARLIRGVITTKNKFNVLETLPLPFTTNVIYPILLLARGIWRWTIQEDIPGSQLMTVRAQCASSASTASTSSASTASASSKRTALEIALELHLVVRLLFTDFF